MGQDIRQALRLLTRAPGFCAVAILTLALGIGSATSVFTVVYTVLLRPLPYPAPERLVQVWERQADGFHAMPSDPNFEDLHERNRSFRSFAQYAPRQRPVTVGDETVRATSSRVSAEFFDVLRVHPSMGRAFLPGELHVAQRR